MARTARSRPLAIGLAVLMLVAGLSSVAPWPAGAMPSGQLGAWGSGFDGELGDGNFGKSVTAVSVLSTGALAGKTIVQVDAGVSFACAVTSDGLVACWGSNNFGQLGIGGSTRQAVPQAVTGGVLAGKSVVKVDAGWRHACAITTDGIVACWGDNAGGELGIDSKIGSAVPVAVYAGGILAGRKVTDVSAGEDFTCAVASGAVSCWGRNGLGQLGDSSQTDRSIPVNSAASGTSALAGKTVTQVAAGQNHACALASDAALACWGSNSAQQVSPSPTLKSTAVAVPVDQGALAGRNVSQISAGVLFTCAVASGSAVCWGDNQFGQAGTGATSKAPQALPALVTVVAPSGLAGKTAGLVSAGGQHACALTTDGTIACWGLGAFGELGTPVSVSLPVPFSVTGTPGSGVMSGAVGRGVSAGWHFTVGLTAGLPNAPTGLSAKPGDGQATVTWMAPVATGGSPVTSFVVQQSTDAGATWTPVPGSPVAAQAASLVVTKLANGTNVTFRVAAVSVAGQGAFSTPTSVVVPSPAAVTPTPSPTAAPSPPSVVKPGAVQLLTRTNTKSRVVALTWQPPATGTAPTSYQVRRKQGAHRYSAWTTTTATSLTLRRLAKGKSYSFAVRAVNPAGFGPGTVVKLTVR